VYKLVIAEKPSVAQSIAKVIGATNREDGFLEGNGYLVSWCVGHLVELAPPDLYEERYSKWIYKDLPIIPDDWKYQVSENTKKQYAVLKKLMNRDDVKSLVAATDSGREGELIFRLVYHQCGCRKPFERLWISSMEDSAIVEGFAGLRAGTEYDALYEAALCRERADWIVGMNATRLFSVLYGQTLNVGRVMTPTLAMMVMRESEIAAFQPEPVYTVSINVSGVEAVSEKYKDKVTADTLLASCREAGKTVVEKNNVAEKKEKPPLLYDLTNLQRDANRILGYTAQQTLDYTQSLYEKKLVTYPRTDSRYLTEDMSLGIENLANMIREKFGFVKALTVNKAQVINNKKVSDHHAIIPTINIADVVFGELPAGEQKVLSLISARFLSALGNSRKVEESTIEFRCGGAIFRVKSKAVRDEGWKEIQNWIMGKNSENEQDEKLINKELLAIFTEGRELPVQNCEMKEGKTSPKHHFTEDTLLNAMEHASADEMPDDAEHQGIGTPATRAGTIEKLVRIGFVERKGDKKTKYLIPTHKGTALITVMPEQIQSASMTADWEEKLVKIEKREYDSTDFMQGIEDMISELVQTYEIIKDAEVLMPAKKASIGNCPICGNAVIEKSKGFFCESNGCSFALWKDNRFFDSIGKKMTKSIAEKLLKEKKTKLKGCHSAKTGKDFDAEVLLSVDDNGRAGFQLQFNHGGKK